MQTTYKFRLDPNPKQKQDFERDQKNCCYVKNRMLGDREYTYLQQHILGDYCRLYDKTTHWVSALIHDGKKILGNGLVCSVNRNVSLGDPWKTGIPSRQRPKKLSEKEKKALEESEEKIKRPSLKRSGYDMQSSALPKLKLSKPELKTTCATALQNAAKQADIAYSRFFKKQSNHPGFKKPRETGIQYPDKECKLDYCQSRAYLPGVGWVKFFNSRDFWPGIRFSKFTVTRQIDQWYISVLVKDESVPVTTIVLPKQVETIVGGDKGSKTLLATSGKTRFENPQFQKAQERRFKILARRVSRKKKGAKNRSKAGKRLARLHQDIQRRREDYQWKVAKSFVGLADANAIEDLNIKGMMKRCHVKKDASGKVIKNGQSGKSGLSKSISDASWYALDQKIQQQSQKQGKLCIKVAPHHTSQECPKCLCIDKSNRDGEKFICVQCGHADNADNNAAVNIAAKAINTAKLNKTVRVVSPEFTPQKRTRRDHQLRLVSRGSHSQNQLERLRHAERRVLNSWIQTYTPLKDSKTIPEQVGLRLFNSSSALIVLLYP